MMRFAAATTAAASLASAEGNTSLPDFSLATARSFASLAETAYCGPTPNMTSWSCDPCVDSGISVEPGSVRKIQNGAWFDAFSKFAFVARLGPKAGPGLFENGCVLAIRGSNNKANMIRDMEVTRMSLDVCDGCKASHGFTSVWNEMRSDIIESLSEIGCVPGGDPLFITGHSLGAAVATIASVDLLGEGFDIRAAYLFESPRTGNTAFAEFFDKQFNGKDVWRITHGRDLVPELPPGFGYQHTGQEVYFDSNGEHHLCSSYQECEQHKPYFRLSVADHCATPLVPQVDAMGTPSDICHCRGWLPLAQPSVV